MTTPVVTLSDDDRALLYETLSVSYRTLTVVTGMRKVMADLQTALNDLTAAVTRVVDQFGPQLEALRTALAEAQTALRAAQDADVADKAARDAALADLAAAQTRAQQAAGDVEEQVGRLNRLVESPPAVP